MGASVSGLSDTQMGRLSALHDKAAKGGLDDREMAEVEGLEGIASGDQSDDDHIITTAEPEDRTPGRALSFAAGAGQGATFGLGDEEFGVAGAIAGKGKQALQALGVMDPDPYVSDAIDRPGAQINGHMVAPAQRIEATGRAETPSALDLYRKERDAARAFDKSAQDAHPGYHLAGSVAGSLIVPVASGGGVTAGAAKAAGNASRWQLLLNASKTGAKLGAAYGAGSSEADLTKGQLNRFAGDVEEGAMFGGATGALMGGASAYLRGRQGKAAADAVALHQKLADKAFNSARGTLGAEVSAGFRTLEQAERAMQDPNVDAAVKAQAVEFLQSDVAKALRDEVLRNAMPRGADQLERIAAAKQEMLSAAANKTKGAVDKAADKYLNKSTLKEDVFPRAAKYMGRAVPQWISNLFGGGDTGKVAGTIAGAQMGDPGTALGNLVRNARFRFKTNGVAAGMLEAGSIPAGAKVGPSVTQGINSVAQGMDPRTEKLMNSKYAQTLQDAAEKGPAALAAAHFVMSQRDPEYRALAAGDAE